MTGQKRKWEEMVDPVKKLDREMAKLALSTKKHGLSQDVAEKAAAKLQQRYDRLGGTTKQTFGPEMLGHVQNWIPALGSVSGAAAGVAKLFSNIEAEAQAASQRVGDAIDAIGELQQVSNDPKQYFGNRKFADSLIAAGVFTKDQKEAATQTAYSFQSAGFSKAEMAFMRDQVGASHFVGSNKLVDFGGRVKKLQNLFGAEEAGTIADVTDKLVTAASRAQADAMATATAITAFGSEARAIGLSDEEAFASFVTTESTSPNPEVAGTRLRSFYSKMRKLQETGVIKKTPLGGMLDQLQGKIAAGSTLTDMLGDVNAVSGAESLLNYRSNYGSQLAAIEGAHGALSRKASVIYDDPHASAAIRKRQQEGRLALLEERNEGGKEALYDALRAAILSTAEARGDAVGKQFLSGLMTINDWTGTESKMFRQFADDQSLDADLLRDLRRYLERSAIANERTADAIGSSNAGRQE